MNHENITAVAVGIVLTTASFLAKAISHGMPQHHHKPIYPVTRMIRLILLCVGLLSLSLGLIDRSDAQITRDADYPKDGPADREGEIETRARSARRRIWGHRELHYLRVRPEHQ